MPRRRPSKRGPAFRHSKRDCVWCGRRFRPVETLSPKTTEHHCSSECAADAAMARLNGPEAYRAGRARAHVRYQGQRSEMMERMAALRARRWQKCEARSKDLKELRRQECGNITQGCPSA